MRSGGSLMSKRSLVLLALGMVIGGGAVWIGAHYAAPSVAGYNPVHVYVGTTTAVDSDGTAIGFRAPGADAGYSVAGAMWRRAGGPWNDWGGTRTCLVPLSQGQELRLAVVNAPPTGSAPGTHMVVWFECLGTGTPSGS
jgi:hypothetical protein